jgi:hypothetical protein
VTCPSGWNTEEEKATIPCCVCSNFSLRCPMSSFAWYNAFSSLFFPLETKKYLDKT